YAYRIVAVSRVSDGIGALVFGSNPDEDSGNARGYFIAKITDADLLGPSPLTHPSARSKWVSLSDALGPSPHVEGGGFRSLAPDDYFIASKNLDNNDN